LLSARRLGSISTSMRFAAADCRQFALTAQLPDALRLADSVSVVGVVAYNWFVRNTIPMPKSRRVYF
jgi:hypothetical protein